MAAARSETSLAGEQGDLDLDLLPCLGREVGLEQRPEVGETPFEPVVAVDDSVHSPGPRSLANQCSA